MEQARYWMYTKRKHDDLTTSRHVSSVGDSWEEQAFAEDAAGGAHGAGCVWPPRSYTCSFCRREFRSAQALGGHMNVHRRDRARLKQSSPNPQIEQQQQQLDHHRHHHHTFPHSNNNFLFNPSADVITDHHHRHQHHHHQHHKVLASPPSSTIRVSTQPNKENSCFFPIVEEHGKKIFQPFSLWSNATDVKKMNIHEEKKSNNSRAQADLSVSLNLLFCRNPSRVSDAEEIGSCKRRKIDEKLLSFFPMGNNSVDDRCNQGSNIIIPELIKTSFKDDLDLELRLGDPPKMSGVYRASSTGGLGGRIQIGGSGGFQRGGSGGFQRGEGSGGSQRAGQRLPIEMPYHAADPNDPSIHSFNEEDDYLNSDEMQQDEDNHSELPSELSPEFPGTSINIATDIIHVTLNSKGELQPERECQKKIKEAIETKFREDGETWTKISLANRDIMFDHWKSFFILDPSIPELQIRKAWEKKAAQTFKYKMYYLRHKGVRPKWLTETSHEKMTGSWKSTDFIALSTRNTENRLANRNGRGSLTNHGGSKSREGHRVKLLNKLGREPSQLEIWTAMNAIVDDNNNIKFYSAVAEEMQTNYIRNLESHPEMQDKPDDYQPPIELQRKVWADTQGISKKGTVVGLGSDALFVRTSTSRPSTPNPRFVSLIAEVEELRSQNATLRKKQEETEQMLEEQEQRIEERLEERIQSQVQSQVQSQMKQMLMQIMGTSELPPPRNDTPTSNDVPTSNDAPPSNAAPSSWPPNMSQPGTFPFYFSPPNQSRDK